MEEVSETVGKDFQKVKSIIKTLKPITRNVIFGIILTMLLTPSLSMVVDKIPSVNVPPINELSGFQGNITISLILAPAIQEST